MDIPQSSALQQPAKCAHARLTFLMVLSVVMLGGWVSACDSDDAVNTSDTSNTSPDTSNTSPDTSDTSSTSPDTTEKPDTTENPDIPDTGEDPELPPLPPPDDSLTNTSLAGVAVSWDAPLVLCNRWREGAPLADELQNKIRVTLWPAPRGLSRNQMEASLLAAVHVERSPFAEGQGHVGAMQADTSLQSYEVTEPQAGATSLNAILVHDLGDLGRIEENFYLWHQEGSPAPDINYNDPDSYWGNFAWFPPRASEGVLLGDCDGPDNLETAVRVFVAQNEQRQIAVKQYFRTIDTFAGSFPVHFVRSEVWFSDEPWRTTYTDTFWAQTYSAQHHNWFENTVIDFTRSLQGFFKYFHPTNPFFPDGTNDQHQALASVLLQNIDAWDVTPSIEVTWRDLDTQADTTESFAFSTDPANPNHVRGTRIDRAFLQRNFLDACGGSAPPNVFAVGYHPSIFQVVACGEGQQASDWRAVVVAGFEQNFSLIGTTIDTLTPGGEHPNGVTFPLGPYTAELSFDAPSEYFRILINHPTDGLVLDTLTPPGTLDPELNFPPEHIQAQSEPGTAPVSMVLSRQWIDYGIGKSATFAPLSFSLTFNNKTYTAAAWDALSYTNTHHNWQDSLSATTPDGHKIFWRYDFPVLDQREPSHLVRAESPDGTEILPETRLLPPAP